MPLYLYRFGFESPRQLRNNNAHGWDDEDSQGVLIEAETEEAALAWGQQVSEQFVRLLHNADSVSWLKQGFAHWVDPPGETWPELQRVSVETFPDFRLWLQPYEHER